MANTHRILTEAAEQGDLNLLMRHFKSDRNRQDLILIPDCITAATNAGHDGLIACLYDLLPDHKVIATATEIVKRSRIAHEPGALKQTLYALEARELSLSTGDSIKLLEKLALVGDIDSFRFACIRDALRFEYREGNHHVLASFARPGCEPFVKALWNHPVLGSERARANAMKCALTGDNPHIAAFIESQGMSLERADALIGRDLNLADTVIRENKARSFQFVLERGMRPARMNYTDMAPECLRIWSASELRSRADHTVAPPIPRHHHGLA